MSNLRNPNAVKLWDFEVFNECFTRGIKVSDINGIVETKGRFLLMETKRPEERVMSKGQLFTLESFLAQGHYVLILFGTDMHNLVAAEAWCPTKTKTTYFRHIFAKPIDLSELQNWVSRWFAWADGQPFVAKIKPYDRPAWAQQIAMGEAA